MYSLECRGDDRQAGDDEALMAIVSCLAFSVDAYRVCAQTAGSFDPFEDCKWYAEKVTLTMGRQETHGMLLSSGLAVRWRGRPLKPEALTLLFADSSQFVLLNLSTLTHKPRSASRW